MPHKASYPMIVEAYSVAENRIVHVSEAIEIRRRVGEYREQPYFEFKEQFLQGRGLQLGPVDNSTNTKSDFFRAFPSKYNRDEQRRIMADVGLSANPSSKYKNTANRVSTVINYLLWNIADDSILRTKMEIEDVLEISKKDLDKPDVLITHKDGFYRKQTRIFVKDGPRKPSKESDEFSKESIDFWLLDILKYTPERIFSWEFARDWLMREWTSFNQRRKHKLDRVLDKKREEIAVVSPPDSNPTLTNLMEKHSLAAQILKEQKEENKEKMRLEKLRLDVDRAFRKAKQKVNAFRNRTNPFMIQKSDIYKIFVQLSDACSNEELDRVFDLEGMLLPFTDAPLILPDDFIQHVEDVSEIIDRLLLNLETMRKEGTVPTVGKTGTDAEGEPQEDREEPLDDDELPLVNGGLLFDYWQENWRIMSSIKSGIKRRDINKLSGWSRENFQKRINNAWEYADEQYHWIKDAKSEERDWNIRRAESENRWSELVSKLQIPFESGVIMKDRGELGVKTEYGIILRFKPTDLKGILPSMCKPGMNVGYLSAFARRSPNLFSNDLASLVILLPFKSLEEFRFKKNW